MQNGWIKLHRRILLNKDLLRHDAAYKLFTVLLCSVDQRGQWSGGRFQLAELCQMKPIRTYRALRLLRDWQMCTLEVNTKYTMISICNWELYQHRVNTRGEQQVNNKRTTSEHSIKNKELRIKNPPLPTTSVGIGGEDHLGQHKNCRACKTNPRSLGTNKRAQHEQEPKPTHPTVRLIGNRNKPLKGVLHVS